MLHSFGKVIAQGPFTPEAMGAIAVRELLAVKYVRLNLVAQIYFMVYRQLEHLPDSLGG